MSAAVSIQGISKTFGSQKALDNVSFDIPAGIVFGLLGPNGAGKTTLFSIIANFLKPVSGKIEVLGVNVENIGSLQGRLSILPQDALFQANVPVREQLEFFAALNGMNKQQASDEATRVLTMVGLLEAQKKNARTLSHGMSKRLGIAQAFMGKPEVIILDEPTAGLDPANAAGVRDLIKEIKRDAKATLIISSHNLNEIQEICQSVAIIDRGQLEECRTVSDLTQAKGFVRLTFGRPLSAAEVAMLSTLPAVTGVVVDTNGEYTLRLSGGAEEQDARVGAIVGQLAATGLVPRSVKEGESLEERFLQVTTKTAS
jgi:ABC-2 type transport system ATP-binding protein